MTQAVQLDHTQSSATTSAVTHDDASPSADLAHLALPVGTHLAEFVITGLIGVDGFGIVYLARDELLGRVVALKEYMPSALAIRQPDNTVAAKSQGDADTFLTGLSSFVNEARMLALFSHPALVKVYRFWESNGTAYLVMPYYQGQTLQKVLTDMPSPPSEAWLRQLLDPLLEALEIIHAKNCFHCDIAPDNIFMLDNGQPVLLAFGAARQVINAMASNMTVILKPGYAPIEQFTSDPNLPQGAWTDIYALGAVLHHAITGHAPISSVSRIVNDAYEPLANRRDTRYTQPFLQTIDKTLAVKATDRPQSVSALRALLALPGSTPAQVAAQAPISPQPAAQQLALTPGGLHRPAWPWVLATLAILLGTGSYFLMKPGQPPAATQPVLAAATPTPPTSAHTVVPHPVTTPAPASAELAAAPPPPAGSMPMTPDSSILTETRETAVVLPTAMSATPVATQPSKIDTRPAPPWLREMRHKLAVCNARGLLEQLVCNDQVRRKYCEPSHWGEVEECRIKRGLSGD